MSFIFAAENRHLVLNKDLQDKSLGSSKKQEKDKIRYQYDEHYFLTDPDEFIQEFWASEPEWQLLAQPISLEEFEALPFVRSIFFHYGLEFTEESRAIVQCDNKGGVEVKINVPDDLGDDIIFHYQVSSSLYQKYGTPSWHISARSYCYPGQPLGLIRFSLDQWLAEL